MFADESRGLYTRKYAPLLEDLEVKLKEEFLRLLKEDEVFRSAVLGLEEILKKLDEHSKILAEQTEEIRRLREEQNKVWKEIVALREEQNRLWGEVKYLRVEVETFGRAVGRTLEDYTISFVRFLLEEMGYPREKIRVGRKILIHDGRVFEVNVFNEDPLVLGEVSTYVATVKEAEDEFGKLSEEVDVAEKAYGRTATLKILAVANAPSEVLNELKRLAEAHRVRLIYGKGLLSP